MAICLVTAPTATDFADLDEIRMPHVRQSSLEPQLGVLSLAAVLEAHGEAPYIVDTNRAYFAHADSGKFFDEDFVDVLARAIAATDADLCGLSTICSSYPLTIRTARAVKALRPKTQILLGGPQASVVDVQTLTHFPFIDFVLRGEAELTLPLLLNELEHRRRFDQVPGLTYRKGAEIRRNCAAPVIQDLDALPAPAYHLTGELREFSQASLELGRGCPFACTFCSTNDFFRRKFRLRSPERILRDMRHIAAEYGIRQFGMVHDMFTVDRRRVVEFCNAMIACGEGFHWSCSARTDCVDEELLELMVRSGCNGIFFGVETGSVRMQKIIDKHLDPERAHQIIDVVESLGIRSTVSIIVGFPEETWRDVDDSMRIFMHSVRSAHSIPQLNILAPLAETPLYSKYKDEVVLDRLCSAMSHQGKRQIEADMALVREHRDIFPNFYLVPTPHLDRDSLLELREISLLAVGHFRWLYSAVDQATTGFLEVFRKWRTFRLELRPELSGPELRQYYRTRDFRADFVRFVRSQPVGRNATVKALLNCEEALSNRASMPRLSVPKGGLLRRCGALMWSDIPIPTRRAEVIELSFDIQRAVEGLKQRREPEWIRGPHFYITEQADRGLDRVIEVSPWVAALLRACDGKRNVREIIRHLDRQFPQKKSVRDYVFGQLLEGAHVRKYIEVYRQTPSAKRAPARAGTKRRARAVHAT